MLEEFIVIFSAVDISLAFSIKPKTKKNECTQREVKTYFTQLLKRILMWLWLAIVYTENHVLWLFVFIRDGSEWGGWIKWE